jgi:hypothetical protein
MDTERSLTRAEWRRHRNISKASHYKMRKLGLAPDEVEVPGTKIARITAAADAAWERRMAELARSEDAKLESERRRAQAAEAGRIAAASPLHISKRGTADHKQPKRRRRA